MYRIVLKIISPFILLASCNSKPPNTLPYYHSADFTPIFTTQKNALKNIHTITEFELTNQHGATITNKNIEGKIHVANFIFTTCGSICPVLTKHMKLVQNKYLTDSNIVMLSYSVMPWIDTVGRLKKYANTNNIIKPNWHLLTGSQSKIYNLARQSYFAEQNIGYAKDSTEFLHTEHILLVDKSKHIRGIYNGTLQLETEQLIKDIELLKQEN
jgi:protein SCO1